LTQLRARQHGLGVEVARDGAISDDEVISMAAEPLAEPDVDDVMAKLLWEMQEKEEQDLGAAYPNHVGQDDEAGR
jgi:hypothetical protein